MTRFAQTNFTGGSSRRVETRWATPSQDASVAINTDPAEVPQGTAREVLVWVGTSKERAQRALDAEMATSDPRKVLASTLQKVVGKPKDPSPEPPPPPVAPAVIVPPATHAVTAPEGEQPQ